MRADWSARSAQLRRPLSSTLLAAGGTSLPLFTFACPRRSYLNRPRTEPSVRCAQCSRSINLQQTNSFFGTKFFSFFFFTPLQVRSDPHRLQFVVLLTVGLLRVLTAVFVHLAAWKKVFHFVKVVFLGVFFKQLVLFSGDPKLKLW